LLDSGAHAQQLCRAVSEAACTLLAASWRSGDQAGVKAAFLPLSDVEGFSALASTANERQVLVLCLLAVFTPNSHNDHATKMAWGFADGRSTLL